MICIICRDADVVDGVASLTLRRGELSYVVRGVPSRICPGCGETYVSENIAVQLLRCGETLSEQGIAEYDVDYSHIA